MMFLYTASADQGIQVATFENTTGTLSNSHTVDTGESFFLAQHPSKRVLYSLSITTGHILAFAIAEDGTLTLLNTVSSAGSAPCHLTINSEGTCLYVANYNGGVVAFPLETDGRLKGASAVFEPSGSGADPKRQAKPHPHGVAPDSQHALLYVADLGTDKLWALRTDTPLLQEKPELSAQVTPGSGPRHLAFAPSGDFAISVNELSNTLSVFAQNTATGALSFLKDYPMLPEGYEGTTHAAEIAFHPSGKAVYATNRGEHSVVTYNINPSAKILQTPHWLRGEGLTDPQHASCDPAGKWLAVSWRTSNCVQIYSIHPQSLQPQVASASIQISKPMCTLFVELKDRTH